MAAAGHTGGTPVTPVTHALNDCSRPLAFSGALVLAGMRNKAASTKAKARTARATGSTWMGVMVSDGVGVMERGEEKSLGRRA